MSSGTSSRELPGWRARDATTRPPKGQFQVFALANRPKQTRASAPKNRNGCKECRRRHVKCDLARPHCTRCAKAGRPCEGYPDSDPPALSGKPRGLVRLVSHPAAAAVAEGGRGADVRILATPAHEAALFRHQKQWDLFHAFVLSHEQGDTILRDGMGLAMLQRTHAEAALREMCCGIGALTNALRHVRDPGAMGAEYGQALEHYGLAVRAVYRAPGGATAHNLMVAIMASVLFVAFDIISGDAAAAAAHHGHAVAMMEQYVDVRIARERPGVVGGPPPPPLGALPFSQLESDMFMWLLRHDTHPWALGFGRESLRTIAPARRFPRCRHRHEMRDVPPVFDDVPQATSWWHVAQHAVLHCLHDIKIRTRPKPEGTPEAEEGMGGGSGSGGDDDDDDDVPRLWAECVRILRTWRASFAPLLQAARRQRDRNYRRWFKAMALETLYIETLSAVDARAVSASGGGGGGTDEETPPPPPPPPPVSPLYLEIIRHAVRLAATRPFNGTETLTDENDLVRPLVAVQYKTRDPAVRRELAAALRRLGGGTGLAESLLFMGECREGGAPVAAIERGWAHAVTSSGMTAGAELLDYLD